MSATDTIIRTGGGLPPPIDTAALAPWPGQISQAPSLPKVVAAIPRPAMSSNSYPTTVLATVEPRSTTTKRSPGRRAIRTLLLLATLGAIGYAGVTYGPQLAERAGIGGDGSISAPLSYPAVAPSAAPVRTATFSVADPAATTQNYEATVDFETGVSRVLIRRPGGVDLEVLTLYGEAVIHRVDEQQWYALPSADFPVDLSLGRARWVRTIDEIVPESLRQLATIEEASESSVGDVPARRLKVTADHTPMLLAAAQQPVSAPGVTVAAEVDGADSLMFEVWVDDQGLVRKSVLPPQLGGETITVISVSADAWVPEYPTPENTSPITAQALFHLGI